MRTTDKDGRPRAADKRSPARPGCPAQREHSLARAGHERQRGTAGAACRLAATRKRSYLLLAEGRCQQRRARNDCTRRPLWDTALGSAARAFSVSSLKSGHKCREAQPWRDGLFHARRHAASPSAPMTTKPPSMRGGHIVRVPLQRGGARLGCSFSGPARPPSSALAPTNARRDARAAGAQARAPWGWGSSCARRRPRQRRCRTASYSLLGRAVDQGCRGLLGTRVPSERGDVTRRPTPPSARRVVQRERKPAGIEARADIGARGRDAHRYHTAKAPYSASHSKRVAAQSARLLRPLPVRRAAPPGAALSRRDRRTRPPPCRKISISHLLAAQVRCHRLGRVVKAARNRSAARAVSRLSRPRWGGALPEQRCRASARRLRSASITSATTALAVGSLPAPLP